MNITPILQAAAVLLAAVITYVVVPYIKSKTSDSQQRQINAFVQIAVAAAEQVYTGSGQGQAKKAYVLEWLREHGITIDEAQLDAMIEAAVYGLKSGIIPVGTGVLIEEGNGGN